MNAFKNTITSFYFHTKIWPQFHLEKSKHSGVIQGITNYWDFCIISNSINRFFLGKNKVMQVVLGRDADSEAL